MTDVDHIVVSVNLAGLQSVVTVKLQRSMDVIRFARAGAHGVTEEAYESRSNSPLRVSPAANFSLSLAAVRVASEEWYTLHVLRDAIDYIGTFLDEARVSCALLALKLLPNAGLAEIQELERDGAKFHKLGLPSKLDTLHAAYNVSATEANYLLALNRARNCLVHRLGIVSSHDLSSADKMEVVWLGLRGAVTTVDGTRIDSGITPTIPPGGKFELFRAEQSREFSVGDKVTLSYDEMIAIMFTILAFVESFTLSVQLHGERCGHEFAAPETAT